LGDLVKHLLLLVLDQPETKCMIELFEVHLNPMKCILQKLFNVTILTTEEFRASKKK